MTEDNGKPIHKQTLTCRLRRKVSKFFKRKVLRLAPWLVGVLAVIWVGGMFFVRPIARSAISELCNGASVYIESGRTKGLTGIRLKGVVIAPDNEALVNAPVFRFDAIDVAFDPGKLLIGKFEVSSIRLSDFLLNATYESGGQWNFFPLLNPSLKSAEPPDKIPLIDVQNGTLRISRIDGQQLAAIATVSLNGQIAVQTGKREYGFSLKTDGRYGFGGSELNGLLKLGDPGEKSRFAAEGKIQMPKTKVFENAWNMEDVRLEAEFDRHGIILQRCAFGMGPGRVNVQGAIQKNADGRRILNLDLNIDRFRLADRYEKNAIVYSEPIQAFLGDRLRNFLTRYHPTGTGDVRLSFKGRLDDLSTARIDGTVTCRDISVLDSTFPYRLEHIQGAIDFSGRNLVLNGLTAEHDDVKLQINGGIENLGPNAQYDIRTTSENLEFNEDLYKALSPSLKQVWYSFTPKGRTAVDYHFQRFADGSTDLTLRLDLKKAGFIYEHFPYPLQNLTGSIVMKPDSVELQRIVSRYDDDRRITLNGQVFEITGPKPKFRIHVRAEQIPVDDLLINAMPPAQQNFFEQLELEAVADIDVDVFPNVVGKRFLDYIAKIRMDGKRLVYKDFPLPMEDIHLSADVTNEMIRLHRFDARTAGGQVVLSGTVLPKGIEQQRPGLCMEVGLKNFDFNEAFWNTAGADAEAVLGKLRIRGEMDVNGHLTVNYADTVCPPTDLVVQCSDNPVLWDNDPLGQAFGALHLTADGVTFENFQLKGIRLESVPQDLLENRLKEVYAGIQPQGNVQVQVEKGMLRLGPNGPDRFDFEGGIILKDTAAGKDDIISNLNGTIDGNLQFDRQKNTWQAMASCQIDHFNYRHWAVSNLRGDFAYDPNTKQFEGMDIIADLYGGRVIGDMEVDFSKTDSLDYKLGFSVNEVDVPRLLEADGSEIPSGVRQGRASGALNLEGDLQSLTESRGKATAHVVNMKLGTQSVLGKILTAMQFKQPEEYIFSEFKAQAFIRGSQLIIEDVRMVGKPLIFRGTGTIDLARKKVEMDWVAFDRLVGSEDTFLDLLARGIGSAIWKVEVRGDISDPQVKAVFLSVLKQPLEIFKKKEP